MKSKKLKVISIVTMITFILFSSSMVFMPSVKAAFTKSDCLYFKEISLSDAVGSHPLYLKVYDDDDNDDASNFIIDCDDHALSNLDDIIFYANDDTTVLPHFVEHQGSDAGGNFAHIFVNLSDSSSPIRMYYGYDSATNQSNGEDTFQFFDDFITNTTSDYTFTDVGNAEGYFMDIGDIDGNTDAFFRAKVKCTRFEGKSDPASHLNIGLSEDDQAASHDRVYFYLDDYKTRADAINGTVWSSSQNDSDHSHDVGNRIPLDGAVHSHALIYQIKKDNGDTINASIFNQSDSNSLEYYRTSFGENPNVLDGVEVIMNSGENVYSIGWVSANESWGYSGISDGNNMTFEIHWWWCDESMPTTEPTISSIGAESVSSIISSYIAYGLDANDRLKVELSLGRWTNQTAGEGNTLNITVHVNLTDKLEDIYLDMQSNLADNGNTINADDVWLVASLDNSTNWDATGYNIATDGANISLNTSWDSFSDASNPFPIGLSISAWENISIYIRVKIVTTQTTAGTYVNASAYTIKYKVVDQS